MTGKPLNEHLRDYYGGSFLPPETLERLVELGTALDARRAAGEDQGRGSARGPDQRPAAASRRRRLLALIAVVAVGLGAVLLLARLAGSGLEDSGRQPDLALAIAHEIALNHVKQLAVEFPAQSFEELRPKMEKLDFSVVASLRLRGLRLLGARYCSLRGQIVAQARLQDGAGRIHTLYQTRLTEGLAGLDGVKAEVDGVRVQLWQEAGLFFGLAGPAD